MLVQVRVIVAPKLTNILFVLIVLEERILKPAIINKVHNLKCLR